MRKVILQLAVSLDSFIEGPNGEYDWCLTDQDYGMSDFFKQIDTIFLGRKSYDMMKDMPVDPNDPFMAQFAGVSQYVFSNTLTELGEAGPYQLVSGDTVAWTKAYKQTPGKDIWLFGGASLTTAFMENHLVDELALAVHPILLGNGKPLFQGIKERIKLELISTKEYSSGLVMMRYKVD